MDQAHVKFPSLYESERLVLRSYQTGDATWYYSMSLRNRAHLQRYEWDNVVATIANQNATAALMQELAEAFEKQTYFFIGAFAKDSGDFVAQIYVGPVDWKLPEFEIGYFADVDHEGLGYVTEAVQATLKILFQQINAHRVRLHCDETNLRSIRVAERCHMTKEGILRENRRNPDGTYSSSLIYGLLKREYLNRLETNLTYAIEAPQEGNIPEIEEFLADHWCSFMMVTKGKLTNAAQIPRIVIRAANGRLVGLLTYSIDRENQSCEIVSLNSELKGSGIGTKLIEMAEFAARENGCRRVWLITTNDNPEAAAFYVKRGYRLVAVHKDALERSRELKPQIPLIGKYGLPLADEWEFEKILPLDNRMSPGRQ